MPIQSSIDLRQGVRLHQASGIIGFEEIKAAMIEVFQHEHFSVSMPAIWDLRQAELNLSLDEMWQLVSVGKQLIGDVWPGKVAILVSQDVVYGQGRMYEQLSDSLVQNQIRIFRDFDQMVYWLTSK